MHVCGRHPAYGAGITWYDTISPRIRRGWKPVNNTWDCTELQRLAIRSRIPGGSCDLTLTLGRRR